jgi:hypothetical protein
MNAPTAVRPSPTTWALRTKDWDGATKREPTSSDQCARRPIASLAIVPARDCLRPIPLLSDELIRKHRSATKSNAEGLLRMIEPNAEPNDYLFKNIS